MGDKIAHVAQAQRAKGARAHRGVVLHVCATRYYQTGERFIHPRSERSMAIYAVSVELFKAAAAISSAIPASNR